MTLACQEMQYYTPIAKRDSLLVTAAVWREPQQTVLISHGGVTSSRAGKAWIDMNTSSRLSVSFNSLSGDLLSSWHDAPVQHSQCY